jgi:hypothetical protein
VIFSLIAETNNKHQASPEGMEEASMEEVFFSFLHCRNLTIKDKFYQILRETWAPKKLLE